MQDTENKNDSVKVRGYSLYPDQMIYLTKKALTLSMTEGKRVSDSEVMRRLIEQDKANEKTAKGKK